jgi:hypothetical protein
MVPTELCTVGPARPLIRLRLRGFSGSGRLEGNPHRTNRSPKSGEPSKVTTAEPVARTSWVSITGLGGGYGKTAGRASRATRRSAIASDGAGGSIAQRMFEPADPRPRPGRGPQRSLQQTGRRAGGPAVGQRRGHLTTPFNVANNCPVLALPSGLSGEGVPTSVQVAGHPREEAMTYRVARAVRAVSGFRLSTPPRAMTDSATAGDGV